MKAKLPKNPFSTKIYLGKNYFCDRQEEIKDLTSRITSGNSVSIIAMRRIGKTGLIKHFAASLPKGYKLAYVDILETESMQDLLEKLSSLLLCEFPEKTRFGKKLWEYIKTLRPTINFDSLTGEPQASFHNSTSKPESNIEQIFNYLENADYKIIIAIDEFQQILQYSEKNVDAWLRTRIQHLQNISFIFSGSQQHLMTELFLNYDRPFYRSTQILRLQKINKKTYKDFIIRLFRRYNKSIPAKVVDEILEWCDTHTFYVQELCNRVFALNKEKISSQDWKDEAAKLLKDNELMFFSFRNMLTKNQWLLLQAIAASQTVSQPTAQRFLTEHQLGGSATVLKSLETLMKIGIVFKDYNEDGASYYGVYDIYLRRWCEQKHLNKLR